MKKTGIDHSGLINKICIFAGLILSGLWFISVLLFSAYSTDMTSQKVLYGTDPLYITIPLTLVFGAALLIPAKFASTQKSLNIIRISVIAWVLLFGAVLIVFSKTVPAADALSNYSIAESFASGDYSAMNGSESYLGYYPHQLGLITYLRLFISVWNLLGISLPAYHGLKVLNVIFVCIIILFQEKTIGLYFDEKENTRISACSRYLLLAGFFAPLLFYSSFVYGEIPSLAAASAGLYFLLKLLRKKSTLSAVLFVLFTALSVMLRMNNMILLIGILICFGIDCIRNIASEKKHFRKDMLITWILCALICFSVTPLTERIYEGATGYRLGNGVSSLSYVAMGMQDGPRAAGWYNGFNYVTHMIAGDDAELDRKLCNDAISGSLGYFADHPKYAVRFYFHKYLSCHADGSYACRQATLATFGGRREIFDRIYAGDLSSLFIGYCNVYQNLIALGTLLFFILLKKKNGGSFFDLSILIGPVTYFGGFLFHMIWEANSRYIFMYIVLLLPYAAAGLSCIAADLLSGKASRRADNASDDQLIL